MEVRDEQSWALAVVLVDIDAPGFLDFDVTAGTTSRRRVACSVTRVNTEVAITSGRSSGAGVISLVAFILGLVGHGGALNIGIRSGR